MRPKAKKPAAKADPLDASHSPSLGPADAPVVIYEFSDFECPFCSRGAGTPKEAMKAFKGKVRLVFKHMPLNFHPDAHLAAQASLAAHAQGKFWVYHDLLFANQEHLKKADLLKYAKQLKLDLKKFKDALEKGTYKKAVDADLALAGKLGIDGTPNFIVKTAKLQHRIEGAYPLAHFKMVIGSLLKGKAPVVPKEPAAPSKAAAPPTPVKIEVGNSVVIGPKDAKITIVEFSDFQCPFCSQGAAEVKKAVAAYKGKVRLVFKHMPLDFHKDAHLSAQASVAAHVQGKFLAYHDLLFANQEKQKKADLLKYAKQLKLDLKKFKDALEKGTYKKLVDADSAQAGKLGVDGTPTMFINGYKMEGAQPFGRLKEVIDALLAGKPFPAAPQPSAPTEPPAPKPVSFVKVDLGQSPVFGPKDAKITIVEFSDFECPYCSRGAEVLKQVRKAYKGKVRFAFKHVPLDFHKNAKLAAQASMAAHAQGKFLAYHDKLFANQEKLAKADLIRYAKELKLDLKKFKKVLKEGTYSKLIAADLAQAQKVGVEGTPTFFVNGYKLEGAQPFGRFKQVIDAFLAGKPFPQEQPQQPEPQAPSGPKKPVKINIGQSVSVGPKDALVTVVEFSDFECPYCARSGPVFRQLKDALKDKVRFVFKHMPLNFHPDAHLAAQASLAAHAQGKFWAYHDLLFANQEHLKKADLLRYAKQLKLDLKKFKDALEKGTYKKAVDADLAEAQRIKVGGTPTFYINGVELEGGLPFEGFKALLAQKLKEAKAAKAKAAQGAKKPKKADQAAKPTSRPVAR